MKSIRNYAFLHADDLTKVVEVGQMVEGIGIVRTDRQKDKIIRTVEVHVYNTF